MKLFSKRRMPGLAAAAAITLSMLGMGLPAHAASDYTAGGGPDVDFVGSNLSFTIVQAMQAFNCPQVDLAGSVVDPGVSRPFGDLASSIDVQSFAGCTNPWIGSFAVTPTGVWDFAIVGNEVGTESPAVLGNVSADVVAAGCAFEVGGTVDGIFDDATQVFTPTTSDLTITSTPTGFLCPILGVASGQDITVDGTWTNSPPAGSSNFIIANASR